MKKDNATPKEPEVEKVEKREISLTVTKVKEKEISGYATFKDLEAGEYQISGELEGKLTVAENGGFKLERTDKKLIVSGVFLVNI